MKKHTFLLIAFCSVVFVNANATVLSGDTAKIQAIQLSDTLVNLEVGAKYVLTATVEPVESAKLIMWGSLNQDVALIDANGVITARGVGTTVVYVYGVSIRADIQPEVYQCKVQVSSSSWEPLLGSIPVPDTECLEDSHDLQNYHLELKDNTLTVSGTFWAGNCKPVSLSYEVYKHTLFLTLLRDVTDSCSLCQRSIQLIVPNCPSDYYEVFFNYYADYTVADKEANRSADQKMVSSRVEAVTDNINEIYHELVNYSLNGDFLTLHFPTNADRHVALYDMAGRLQSSYFNIQDTNCQISINMLPRGVYVLRIINQSTHQVDYLKIAN